MADPGPSKISLSLGSQRSTGPAKAGTKRPRAALHDDEDEDHDRGVAQTVSHFDKSAGGAIDAAKPVQEDTPLIIAPQKNRDWKEAAAQNRKRQKSGLPNGAGEGHGRDMREIDELDAKKKPAFGLNVNKRKEILEDDEQMEEVGEERPQDASHASPPRERTLEEQAVDALLGKAPKSTLVLPAMTAEQEEVVFQRDIHSAPDLPTLDDYARVPVEEFGAALLRGMGWKEGQGIGNQRGRKVTQTKVPERRPALLGIGAKEDKAVAAEMGVWGKAAKRGHEVKVYNPVLIRDKRTGEMFTEDELKEKREREEKEKYEREFERERKEEKKRRERDGSGDRDRDRERKRDRSRDRRREKEKDRDGERSQRDRHRHDESDEEYYRRKEERRRRERDRKDDDRERSRRHDHDRERDRHREKDRHRDRR